jgi:hypothetical protein
MAGGEDDARDFFFSAYCCIPLHIPLASINLAKALVASSNYVSLTTNTRPILNSKPIPQLIHRSNVAGSKFGMKTSDVNTSNKLAHTGVLNVTGHAYWSGGEERSG